MSICKESDVFGTFDRGVSIVYKAKMALKTHILQQREMLLFPQ